MKNILGLDIGTNSIGWFLISEDKSGKISIIDRGVYIFPIGTIVDDVTGKEKTKNEQRREYRGSSRNHYRYKLRREQLKFLLQLHNMLPDFSKYYKAKHKKQSIELYKYRADALKTAIPLNELGRIFLLINKHRGFQSNSKKIGKKDDEIGKVKEGIAQLEKYMLDNQANTIGEYFYLMHKKAQELYKDNKWHNDNEPIDERALNENGEIVLFNSNGIRRHYGRYTLRDMYKIEFDLIWQRQKEEYPELLTGGPEEYQTIKKLPYKDKITKLKEFRNTLYWKIKENCIFYQRPLKSQKKYVSNCQFEKGKKVVPASHPLFQEFRIYKQLSDIRYSDDYTHKAPLKPEWISMLAKNLKTKERIYLKPSKQTKDKDLPTFFSILNLPEKSVEFIKNDPDGDSYVYGNTTYSTFYEALGKDKFEKLEAEGKLEQLWHTIYIAKDGLFKENEWLLDILTEPTKWDLNNTEANKIIYNGLEEEYGSYSSKVIKSILPFMKNGDDEYNSLVNAKYLSKIDDTIAPTKVADKITQLRFNELRNPVVEKAVSKAIRIVNEILEKYKTQIDRNSFEIRIESTRDLKKPRNARENIRRLNRDKDILRQEYADFLNSKRDILGFSRKIEKYDGLINKYELWLEMGMDTNDGRFSKKDFDVFTKITKPGDRLIHALWRECNRICPYTHKTIPLNILFTPEIEIEHIIPLSRSLDDSFINKTLTFYEINKEKGSRTAFEYMKDNLDVFKRTLKHANFSDNKIDQFLKEDIGKSFSNDQITNTSYIAKYVKKKMFEVCKNVQFTNGSVTAELRNNDWKLSDFLDKIRYEEETNKNVDETISNFNECKSSFLQWLKSKNKNLFIKVNWTELDIDPAYKDYNIENKTDLLLWWNELKEYNQFRNKSGKKDRSDHRHHALDAFIIACCSPSIIKTLSTYNAYREEQGASLYDENRKLTRKRIELNFDLDELRNSFTTLLVTHYQKQILIKKKINRIKAKNEEIKDITYAPQGSLHEESIYGKRNGNYVKRVRLYDDKRQDKILFEELKDLDNQSKGDKWHKVPEIQLYEAIHTRLKEMGKKALSKEMLTKEPFYMVSPKTPLKQTSKKGKTLPVIKSIRHKYNIKRSMIHLPAKNSKGEILNNNRWVSNQSNYMMVFYINNNGKKKFAKPLSFFEAVERKRNNLPLLTDEIEYRNETYSLDRNLPWLKTGDIVFLCIEGENETNIDWSDNKLLSKRLFKVKGFTSSEDNSKPEYGTYEYGNLTLINVKISKSSEKYKIPKNLIDLIKLPEFPITHNKLNAIKVRLNPLGQIIAKGKDCF